MSSLSKHYILICQQIEMIYLSPLSPPCTESLNMVHLKVFFIHLIILTFRNDNEDNRILEWIGNYSLRIIGMSGYSFNSNLGIILIFSSCEMYVLIYPGNQNHYPHRMYIDNSCLQLQWSGKINNTHY